MKIYITQNGRVNTSFNYDEYNDPRAFLRGMTFALPDGSGHVYGEIHVAPLADGKMVVYYIKLDDVTPSLYELIGAVTSDEQKLYPDTSILPVWRNRISKAAE